jgi:hypothetical protein
VFREAPHSHFHVPTCEHLALLYSDTQRMKEAEEACQEALSIRRELAKANPDVYLPDVGGLPT